MRRVLRGPDAQVQTYEFRSIRISLWRDLNVNIGDGFSSCQKSGG